MEKRVWVVPGIHVNLGHHASWQEMGQYVAVCQIDNQIPSYHFASIIEKEEKNQKPMLQKEENLRLQITKIQGFLTYADSSDELLGSSNLKLIPMELTTLTDAFRGITQGLETPETHGLDFNDVSVEVPFGKSIQLLFKCRPFGPLPFKGWKHLKSLSSSSIPLTPLLQIFQVRRAVEMEKQTSLRHSPLVDNTVRSDQDRIELLSESVEYKHQRRLSR